MSEGNMKKLITAIGVTIVLVAPTTNVSISSEKVYESVDEKGNVSFSDQPNSNAKKIEVKPNVVDITPAADIDNSSKPANTAPAELAPSGHNTQDPNYVDEYGYGRNPRERKAREEQKHEAGPDSKQIQAPAHQEAPHGGGHR